MVDRYSRQTILPQIGEAGQARLGGSRVVIVGCGALGSVMATALVRAGVGRVKIIDRDFLETHNLQRQVIFDEDDVRADLPKAVAAARHLQRVNSSVEIEGVVADLSYANAEELVAGSDLILDGLDNLESRLLLNDVSLKLGIPWVYGGAVATTGMTMNVIPGETPCFRCVWGSPAGPGPGLTCDTAGVINTAPFVVGSLQATEAVKILVGAGEINRDIITVDVWTGELQRFKVSRRADCPACRGKYEYLERRQGTRTLTFCGQNSVQVSNPEAAPPSLEVLAARLKPLGEVSHNDYMLRFDVDNHEMVVLCDGRVILRNSTDEALARGLYAKYIGG